MNMGTHKHLSTAAPHCREIARTPYRVYGEGDDLYASMLADIGQAKNTIRLESYIFSGDEIGWQFAAALAEKAGAGVTVRVHVDAAGALFEGTDKLFRFLSDAGAQTRWFNRWQWRDPLHYNRRNHRKFMVVDDRCVYVGGFNLHRESSFALYGPKRWRDAHVRIAGPLSAQAATLFDEFWNNRICRIAPSWDGDYRLVPNVTRHCRRTLYCLQLDALTDAQHHIYLTTPYFVPDRKFRAALMAASRRDVDVRVLLPAQSDNRLVQWTGHALARSLVRSGVRFFEYQPRMLHAKTLLIDGRWATVGSANTDYRSFFTNRELNLVTRSAGLCSELECLFQEDLAQSSELDLGIRQRDQLRAVVEKLGQRFRRWL
jgi:cardiolipin synthase A/B